MKKLLMEIIEDCEDKTNGCPYCTNVKFCGYMCAYPNVDRTEEERYTPDKGVPDWCPLSGEIEKLGIKDGDTIIIRFNDPIPAYGVDQYRDILKQTFPNNKIVILFGKISMEIEKKNE